MVNINSILAKIIQIQTLTINKLNSLSDNLQISYQDYTAFQVFAHNYNIPVGECEELSGLVNYEMLPAQMSHCFTLRSAFVQADQNIIIDWGDGNTEEVKDIEPTGSAGDYRYKCLHTYSNTGKYIIKIYGNTYFALIQGNGPDPNIICRIFDKDLPIASHIKNFSSFARSSKHLLNVNVSKCKNFNKNYINISMLFYDCTNLVSATGFSIENKINIAYSNILANCYSLETTNFVFIPTSYGINGTFNKCYKLVADIYQLFYLYQASTGSSVSLDSVFSKCKNLYGVIPANKLWNNKNITWTNTENCFAECSKQIIAQAPVSWGGTNQSIDLQLSLSNQIKSDYTAFEVCPHIIDIEKNDTTTLYGKVQYNKIPATTVHRMVIRTKTINNLDSDVVIDWGDGTYTSISNGDYNTLNNSIYVDIQADIENGQANYTVEHDYAKNFYDLNGNILVDDAGNEITSRKYVIKIYGKKYFGFKGCHYINEQGNYANDTSHNLTCKCLDSKELPVASHLRNFSSFCLYAIRLTNIDFSGIPNFQYGFNCASMFNNCKNLTHVYGFQYVSENILACPKIFKNCMYLNDTDFRFPSKVYDQTYIREAFNYCIRMSKSPVKFLPIGGFKQGQTIDTYSIFSRYGYSIGKTNIVDTEGLNNSIAFWNNKTINWILHDSSGSCFHLSHNSLMNEVPKSWGGIADDDIIEKTVEEKIDLTNKNISLIEQRILQLESKLN